MLLRRCGVHVIASDFGPMSSEPGLVYVNVGENMGAPMRILRDYIVNTIDVASDGGDALAIAADAARMPASAQTPPSLFISHWIH